MSTAQLPVDYMHIILQWKDKFEADINALVGYPVEVIFKMHPNVSTEATLQTMICNAYGLSWSEITKKTRKRPIPEARHTYCYFASYLLKKNYDAIAKDVGLTHHSTVIHSINTVKDWINIGYEPFTTRFNQIKSKFYYDAKAKSQRAAEHVQPG